jgi:hypothetical protein
MEKIQMREDISIGKYEETDRNGCIDLLINTFTNSSSEDTFKWRFESTDRRKPLLVCAKHKGRVVSFNSWIPWEFLYRDHLYVGYQSGESATHIDYRGQGIFNRVIKYADQIATEEGIDFFFGFPNPISYGAFIKSVYYPIETYYFSVRLQTPFKNRIELHKRKSGSDVDYLNFFQENKITPFVNNGYCQWRYENNTKNYVIIDFIEGNSRASFYMRENVRKGFPELLLLDFQVNNYNERFIDHVFRHIDSVYTRTAVYMRTFFSMNSDRGRALKRHFPIRIKTKYQILIVKNISNRIPSSILLNANNWDIMPHCADWL